MKITLMIEKKILLLLVAELCIIAWLLVTLQPISFKLVALLFLRNVPSAHATYWLLHWLDLDL